MLRIASVLASLSLCQHAVAADPANREPVEVSEGQVLDYLASHPRFLLENSELVQRAAALQRAEQQMAETRRRQEVILRKGGPILSSKLTPVRGRPTAAYTLIEFSDYQCLPCKHSFSRVESFFGEHGDLRLIQLQLPIYGPNSVVAARAALIAQELGHFEEFHKILMQTPLPINLEEIETALAVSGISAEEFESKMSDPGYTQYLQEVKAFSSELNVVGTPAFFLNGQIITGALGETSLRDALNELNNKSKD